MKEKISNKNIPYLIVLLNIAVQLVLFGKYIFSSEVMSALHPYFGDSREYIDTTEKWMNSGDFVSTFNSGYRLPGYSSFILLNYKLANIFNCNPLLFLRIVQMITAAFIPFFSYKALFNYSKSYHIAFLGALVICLYYPFYYFTPLISTESISLFFISILLWQISRISSREAGIKDIISIGLFIFLLTNLRPNLILFSIPAGILLINYKYLVTGKIFRAIKKPVILAVFMIVLMLPWMIFISTQNKMFIPLATTSGIVMVLGTGIQLEKNTDTTSLTYKYEMKHNLNADSVLIKNTKGLSFPLIHKSYQEAAIRIWEKRPWLTFKYGFVKVANWMGLGFRGPKDYLSFCIIFPALLILIFSKRFRKMNRNLVIFVSVLLLLICFESFVYTGDMRFRILLLDMPLLYMISIYLYTNIFKRLENNNSF